MTRRMRPPTLAVALAVLAVLFDSTASAAPPYASSIASTGDSITRAYNTGRLPFTDNPNASWSTGTNSTVASHYSRLLAVNPAISGNRYNDAVSGAKMADLNAQVTTVNARQVEYVTILMGGNDVCASSEAAMTPVADYRAQFELAMTTLTTGSPTALVFVVSIPSVYHLWAILKDNAKARRAWSTYKICQSMLANPLSTAQEDVDRRSRVRQRNIDYNTELAAVCALYTQCLFDGNAIFNEPFTTTDVSTRDYFHPSLAGQKKLAAVTWSVGYWGH